MDSVRVESNQIGKDPLHGHRERRSAPRVQCKGLAEFLILPDGPKFMGSVVNLCLGGCLIETEKDVPDKVLSNVEVQIDVDDFRLRLAGCIRHIEDDYLVGIQFTDVSLRKKEQIQHLMAELQEMEKQRLAAAKAMRQNAGEE